MGSITCSRNTSFAFFIINLALFIIAFSTPFWYAVEENSKTVFFGLWLICASLWDDGDCEMIGDYASSELKATQAMMCIAMIFLGVALIAYCVWMSKSPFYLASRGVAGLGITSLVLALVGGVFNMIGVIIFGAYYQKELFDDIELEDLYYHGSFICAALTAMAHMLNSIATLSVMICCYSPQESTSNTTAGITLADLATTGTTVAVITDAPVPIQAYPPQQGFLPQADLGKPGPYYPDPALSATALPATAPMYHNSALSATAPIYPEPGSYNPDGYHQNGANPAPSGANYTPPGGVQDHRAVPNMYEDPPPPYLQLKM